MEVSGGVTGWKWGETLNVTCCAGFAGYLIANWFGKNAGAGWLRALFGAILTTALGAWIAFAVSSVPYVDFNDIPEMVAVSILAPIFVFVATVMSLEGLVVWVACFAALHWILRTFTQSDPI